MQGGSDGEYSAALSSDCGVARELPCKEIMVASKGPLLTQTQA